WISRMPSRFGRINIAGLSFDGRNLGDTNELRIRLKRTVPALTADKTAGARLKVLFESEVTAFVTVADGENFLLVERDIGIS
ncbi:MAG: hypothetical protein VX090_16385, partial [Pseudomonadota bacterium]|nr:hypothetical protein [Pseudomonadota bacterium]